MALARVKTWNPGDVLTAADLNAEFNNILNNPISLVSPTTGAINFQTSVAHTNLQVSALTASSGFLGSVLVTSTAATPVPLWSTGATAGGVFMATTAAIPTWSSGAPAGGVFISNSVSLPAWSVAAPTAGVLIASTGVTPTWLSMGTSGRIPVAATSGSLVASTGMNFVTTSRHFAAQRFVGVGQATALTSANFTLSSGWGSTAVLQSIQGGDQAYSFSILTGSTMGGNPTVTTTFADGSWQAAPVGVAALTGGTGITSTNIIQTISIAVTASGQTLQMFFTPSTGLTYTYSVVNFG